MYVEFINNRDVLSDIRDTYPDIKVNISHLTATSRFPLRLTCSVRGNTERFEARAHADQHVETLQTILQEDSRTLYHIYVGSGTVDERVYNAAVNAGGVHLNAQNMNSCWYTKMSFPDKASFTEFWDTISEEPIETEITVMRDGTFHMSEEAFGLTQKQLEIIWEGLKTGYFEVPRETTLQELGEKLDITTQAASIRLRKGVKTLVENSVYDAFDPEA
ncbi:hypothetical protein SAMN05216226_10970 [Halovenus aranensis]|jgi:predicted DNA binding protein|uniref:HTH bat-type domain-containing protein n=1 Tax=Halovenus aranensis TaxID=890420 RepID=A0A1G8WK09_9EURY|nr:helix-turn-helix domain-containing protein [Halovenus aranensis]SDJ78682.1 hypothetical protein SAMN05216226_10970 [Halovenus aranensis]